MTQRYVIGVDGSGPGTAALLWAVDRARRVPAPIVLVHVNDDEAGMMGHDYEAEVARRGAVMMTGILEQVEHWLPDLDVSVVLLQGSVPWELASYVGADDLLVIGTGKTGFLHGRVLGSRSVRIALAAPCSVAVIPEVDLRFRRGVVAGIDRHATASDVARAAADEAVGRAEELLLVQAMSERGIAEARPGRVGLAVTTALDAARAAFPRLELRSRLSSRQPAEALLDSSRDRALLVLGPGSVDPQRSPIGSVLHDVLLNINSPVLVSRSPAA